MKTLTVACPDRLYERLRAMAREGWVADPADAVIEALRRYLDSHDPALVESQLRTDVQWGLHGDDQGA